MPFICGMLPLIGGQSVTPFFQARRDQPSRFHAASPSEWQLARQREAVIRPLAEADRLSCFALALEKSIWASFHGSAPDLSWAGLLSGAQFFELIGQLIELLTSREAGVPRAVRHALRVLERPGNDLIQRGADRAFPRDE